MLSKIIHIDNKIIVLKNVSGLTHFFKGESAFLSCSKENVKVGDEVRFSLVQNKGYVVEGVIHNVS